MKTACLFVVSHALLLMCLSGVACAQSSVNQRMEATLSELESADEIIIKSEFELIAPPNMPVAKHHGNLQKGWTQSLPYRDEIQAVASALAMDPALLHAVIMVESGYQAKSVSRKGAYGLMQVIPATAKAYSAKPLTQMNAYEQIDVGARYLKSMLTQFDDQLGLALAAYNAGPQAVVKYHAQIPPYAETQKYVPQVLYYYARFKAQLALSASE